MAESYWQREAGWRDRWHLTPIPTEVHFAVIGAGISGLATALRLRERNPDAQVLVLEAERVGYGASGRNAGFLSPVAAPIWLLSADRSTNHGWAVAHLNAQVHALARWLANNPEDAELANASLSIESPGRITDAGLSEFARALKRSGVAHRLEPSRVQRGHLFLEMDAYTVHPYKLVLELAERAIRAGIRIRERAPVQSLEPTPGGARVRLANGDSLIAGQVIVCTNAYTDSLDTGEKVRARSIRSFMLATTPLDPAIEARLVRDADFTVQLNVAETYHRMHKGRILYGGDGEELPPDSDDFAVPGAVRSKLAKRMRRSCPDAGPVPIAHSWSGQLHASATDMPIIRRSRAIPAVTFNVGYSGTGVALAMICAPLVAALASNGPFASAEDARLLSVIQQTTVPAYDAARAAVRLVGRLARPWRQR